MFGALKAGGILMLPIILCGTFATFIIVERCYYFYVTKKRDIKLMFDLKNSISEAAYVAAAYACSESDVLSGHSRFSSRFPHLSILPDLLYEPY